MLVREYFDFVPWNTYWRNRDLGNTDRRAQCLLFLMMEKPIKQRRLHCLLLCTHSSFSKFGVCRGTALTNGPLVQTGFRPAWVLIKNISIVENWLLFDSARDPDNGVVEYLLPNGPESESSGQVWLDFLSNGFKIRATNSAINGQQHSIVYMAFAEHPLKTVRAR